MTKFPAAFFFTSVFTLAVCVFGIVGHTLCLLVLQNKEASSSSYKHLLQGLSVSDLLLLILSLLRTLVDLTLLDGSNGRLPTLIFFWDWICTSGTKYFTVAISLERFFVVAFPLKANHLITPWRSKMFASSVLIFILVLSCLSYGLEVYITPTSFDIYTAVVLHFTPFIIVLLFNVLIYLALRHHGKFMASFTATSSDRVSATPMLFTVVTIFGICYSFEFVRRILHFSKKEYMTRYEYYEYSINHLANIFYVLNSSVNIVIYYFLGSRFRAAFLKFFENLRFDLCCNFYSKYWQRKGSTVTLIAYVDSISSSV